MTAKRLRQIFALAVAVAGLGATLGARPPVYPSKLDHVLRGGATGEIQVIVRARPGMTGLLRAHLLGRGTVLKDHALIGALTARVPASRLSDLDGDAAVDSVSLDAPMIATTFTNAQTGPGVELVPSLGLPVPGVTGHGVGVLVIDSGLDTNEDFGSVRFFDFTPAAGHHAYDDFGHGTHVSGLIASKGHLSQTPSGPLYPGIAPKAHLISVKVLDAHGTAMTSTVIEALEFAIKYKKALGIDVINLSLGHPIFEPPDTDPLVRAVEAATEAGIIVVVAAGNVGQNPKTGAVGYAGILSPANAESAITVGALDTRNTVTRGDDAVPQYSSRGPTWFDARPKPDFVAPGQNLVSDAAPGSTLYLEHPDHLVTLSSKHTFFRLSGTSMAAAVTSGVVALLVEASRRADGTSPPPRLVKDILSYTATPLAGYDGLTQGHGALNAAGAIAVAKALSAAASTTGNWWTTLHLQPFTVVAGESWPWAQSTVFPPSLTRRDGVNIPAWAQTIVWGSSRDGDTIVWGTNADGDTIVWGTDADGDTIVWGTSVDWTDAVLWGTAPQGLLPGG